ncbi:hypothetical protein COCNU_scaffold019491G000010 [Cocos nucifera]|nr:hypothetical protein [Cocos nucifera]
MPRLKQTILLRRIISELSRDSVSARTLHSLELLEEIDRNGGVAPSESMRAVYFVVAMECTTQSLLKSDEHFFKTIDQIWSHRVADLERSKAAGLMCSRLKKFRKEILEATLLNPGIKADLLGRGTEKMTFDSVIRTELLRRTPKSLVLALPITRPLEPRLKQTILLRRIISELSRDSVSARTLHSLELLEEIDRNGGVAPSESMRAAYFAVAVECTARSLLKSDEHFFKTVDQIWSRRVADLERSEAAGLMCSRLKKFRKEIVEAALLNPGIKADLLGRGTEKMTFDSVIRTELLEKDTKKVALDCVRAYLEDAINMMGLPLLEVTAKAVLSGRFVLKEQSREPSVRTGKKEKCSKDVSISIVEKNVDELGHSQIDGGTSSRSHVIMEELDDSAAARGQNVPNQLGGCLTNKLDRLPSPEVNRVVQALKSSSADLHMMVVDPLPNARTAAAEVVNSKCGIMMNLEQEERQDQVDHMGELLVSEMDSEVKCDKSSTCYTEKNKNSDIFQSKLNPYGVKEMEGNHIREEVNASVGASEKGTDVSITAGTSGGVEMKIACNVVPTRPSLMDWNPTAHTYEVILIILLSSMIYVVYFSLYDGNVRILFLVKTGIC